MECSIKETRVYNCGRLKSFNFFATNSSFFLFVCFVCLFVLMGGDMDWLLQTSFFLLFLTVLGLHCYTKAFSRCSQWGLLSSCGGSTSLCSGFSCPRAQAVGHMGSGSFRS